MLATVQLDREDDEDEPNRPYKWKCPRCSRWVFEPLKRTCRLCKTAVGTGSGVTP